MRNNGKSWDPRDLEELSQLYKHKYSMHKIAKILGRSPKSIEHAFRHIVFQQLLHHTKKEVADSYNMSVEDLENTIVSPKFYVPVTKNSLEECMVYVKAFLMTGMVYYGFVLWDQYSHM